MSHGPDITYIYDGSFDGFLCCVFESYLKNEVPAGISPWESSQCTLLPTKEIVTDEAKARRVAASIPQKMGREAREILLQAFLTCMPDKELHMLKFLRLGYKVGARVVDMLADNTVNIIFKAVKQIQNESQLIRGFIRFSDYGGMLVSEIEPKNIVLPMIAQHFCERFPNERFMIHDKTNAMALMHSPGKYEIAPVFGLDLPSPDETELFYRGLWKLFYDTIEVPGRHNPRCRMGHMPKRYWKHMTEFTTPPHDGADAGPSAKLLPKLAGYGLDIENDNDYN